MVYRELQPAPALRRYVRCYWMLTEQRSVVASEPQPIFPDGCMEVAVHFGDPFERCDSQGVWRQQASALLVGQMLSPTVIRPCGETGVLGIRFQPTGLHRFCAIPKQELRNKIESLDHVWPAMVRLLQAAARSPQRVRLLDDFLQGSLRPCNDDRIAKAAAVFASNPTVPIDTLISHTGMSPRTFRRDFTAQVGLGPKSFGRIVRFQRALVALQTGAQVDAALHAGYYDQPHMVHDFQQFAGCPPSALLTQDGQFLQDR